MMSVTITIFKGKFNLCNAHNPIASFNISFFLVHYSNICNMLLQANAPAHREQHLLKDSDRDSLLDRICLQNSIGGGAGPF